MLRAGTSKVCPLRLNPNNQEGDETPNFHAKKVQHQWEPKKDEKLAASQLKRGAFEDAANEDTVCEGCGREANAVWGNKLKQPGTSALHDVLACEGTSGTRVRDNALLTR